MENDLALTTEFKNKTAFYMTTAAPVMCKEPPMDFTRHRVIPVFYIILCVVGVVGNGLVIKVLWSLMDKSNIKSVTDILVFNLAVADFIFVSSLPFWGTDLFFKER